MLQLILNLNLMFIFETFMKRKKMREKAEHPQNLLPVRDTSGQGPFRSRDCHFRPKGPTRVDIAQHPVAHAQNILPDRARDWRHVRSCAHMILRYDNITEIPSVRTTRYGLKSFRYAAAKLWNELQNHFRTQTSFSQFKNLINSWNGNACC